MFKSRLLPLSLLLLPWLVAAQPRIDLQPWASGFTRPVDVAHCGDSRVFVVEQRGVITVLDSLGNKLNTFLDIVTRVNSTGNEQGLLGLAFHPNYAQNGYFFVYYTTYSSGSTQVSRFSVKPANPNEADANSEFSIFSTPQPYSNHNGGCIKFGPDGYLYIGLGDGGSGGDPLNNGQKKNTFLGKILRIDVNNSAPGQPYVVPANNPFVGQSDYFPEIWSLGLRNPWRYSFDRLTGDMWIGDVGQVTREEVDFEPAGMGGRNYGWRCYEGTVAHNTTGCQPQNTYVGPVFDYDNNSIGCSMTGGFVYRGAKYPDLYGIYFNADYCSGRIWGTTRQPNGTFNTVQLANLGDYEFSSFGEDRDGQLYVCMLSSGQVRKIIDPCAEFKVMAAHIETPVCAAPLSGAIDLTITNPTGNVTYAWSNGANTAQIGGLVAGTYTVTVTNGNGCSRIQSFDIQHIGPASAPSLSAADSTMCPNQNLILTARGFAAGDTLIWYKDNTAFLTTPAESDVQTLVLTPFTGGMYRVRLVNDVCTELFSSQLTVFVESPMLPNIGLSGDTLYSDGPCISCQWLFNGQPIPGATADFYVATFSGVYELQMTSPNGCVYGSTGVNVDVVASRLPSDVRHFNLSPNPTDNSVLLEMELNSTQRLAISLSDTSQRQIFMQNKQTQELYLPIDLRALPSGTYLLKVQLENGASFVRPIVKH